MTPPATNTTGVNTIWGWILRAIEQIDLWTSSGGARRDALEADYQLAVDAIAGRSEAMKTLIRRLKPELLRMACGMAGNGQSPTVLAEKMFLKVFRLLNHYRPETRLEDWAIRMACSAGLQDAGIRFQQRRREAWSHDDVLLLEAIDCGDVGVSQEEAAELLDRVLNEMPPAERLAKRLHDLDGESPREICRWTGWSEAKWRQISERARRRFDALLREICATDLAEAA